jgi:hypothetical protein
MLGLELVSEQFHEADPDILCSLMRCHNREEARRVLHWPNTLQPGSMSQGCLERSLACKDKHPACPQTDD